MDLSSHLAAELTLVIAILECLNVKCVCNSLKKYIQPSRFKSQHRNSLIIGKYAGRKIWKGAWNALNIAHCWKYIIIFILHSLTHRKTYTLEHADVEVNKQIP
uniref:(northern house mosquito) hypothetical protein n=1 Tax=Culex pipiens TaxID=7175 RepID=A0A8D8CUL7_CULPI